MIVKSIRQLMQPIIPRGTKPIILGPWLGEVGPELQYWIPFLQQLKLQGHFEGRRVIAVSRGGAAAWYSEITNEYVEIFDLITLKQYQDIRGERTGEKQFAWTSGEKNLVQNVLRHLDINNYASIHPGVMWENILGFFQEKQPLTWILSQLHFQKFPITHETYSASLQELDLPNEYVALRFYQSSLFPATDENKKFVQTLIEQLVQSTHVVVMENKVQFDDHEAFPIPTHDNVTRISTDTNINNNLTLQSAILAKAKALYGTYGGITILPGLLELPCFGFVGAPLGNQQALHFQHEAITVQLYEELGHIPYSIQSVPAWILRTGLESR